MTLEAAARLGAVLSRQDRLEAPLAQYGRHVGTAEPLIIGRHTHPRAPQAARPIPPPTGIDYLGLVQAAHDDAAGDSLGLAYRDVPLFDPDHPDSEDDDDPDGDDGAAGVPAVTPCPARRG